MERRIFLSSSLAEVKELLEECLGAWLKGRRVAFIPTAARVEEVDFYVQDAKEAFEALGAVVEWLDIALLSAAEAKARLEACEALYVSGGNTFYLLSELRRVGLEEAILWHIKQGKPYIGESAGSMILAPSVEHVQLMDDVTKAGNRSEFKALGAIDFYPLPHVGEFPFVEVTREILERYEGRLNFYPLNNKQAIWIEGERVEVKG